MGGEDHAGSADSALCTSTLEEALLDGVELLVDSYSFDGSDVCAFCLQGGDEAGVDQFSVHEDGAGAALAFAAAFFCAGEVEVFAEDVEEALHGRDFDGLLFVVDCYGDLVHMK